MGSIYKRVRKRPIPKNAEIITHRDRTMVLWGGKNHRKYRSPLTDDGRQMLVESQTYYMKYTDQNGAIQIENTLAADKQTARQVLSMREKRVTEIKAGIIDPVAERLRKASRMSLSQHVEEFKKFMQDKGGDPKHVDQTAKYIDRLIKYCEATHYSHLSAEGVLGALRRLQTEPVQGRRGHKNRSPRTANAHLVAIKSFCRWMVRTKRTKTNPVETLEKFIETTEACPDKVQGVDGPTRATIYLLAAMTGLRRKELASLTIDDFHLDAPTPIVRIQGAYSKNKRTDEIPLHPDVVARLRAYFAHTNPEPGQPIFPLYTPSGYLRATAKMMKHDCESAGLKYSTPNGILDFHANRVLFITSLCRSNVNLIMAQKLARHSDPKLTSNVYSKITTEERAAAINGISLKG
ncbi:MAG: site-specific integrase [Planctomycetia bacterium]|jgi:integrase